MKLARPAKRLHILLVSALISASTPVAWATATSTTTTLAVTSAGSVATTIASGSAVTLTATVKAGTTAVTPGQVIFCDATAKHCSDIHLLGTAQLTKAGAAVLRFRPGIGSHSYKAVFLGTENAAASASNPSALAVTGKYGTATTFVESGFAGNYELTATVAGYASKAGVALPSGKVSFVDLSDGNAVLGTAALGTVSSGLNWASLTTPTTGTGPGAVAVGDFNGDGIPDMAIANSTADSVTILLGKGDGTFTAIAKPQPVGGDPVAIAVGDFNGDGRLDLAVVNYTSDWVTILLGNGDGTFTDTASAPSTGGSPNAIAVGDFNGDGNLDLAIVDACSASAYCTTPGELTILLGNGDGTFTAAASPAANGYSEGIAVADFNGDGIPDLAVVSPDYGMVGDGAVTIYIGNGDGTFTPKYLAVAGTYPVDLAVGDFNGDGIPDLAVSSSGTTGTLTVLLGNGNGTFTAAPATPAVNDFYPGSIAVADFNGDGNADLAVFNGNSHTAEVFAGNGAGGFTLEAESPYPGYNASSLAVADFNGDGISDLAAANLGAVGVTVLLTQSQTVTVTAKGISPLGAGLHQVEASYPGDSNYSASVSPAIGLLELPPSTTTTLAVTAAGAVVSAVDPGTVVMLTATVKAGSTAIKTGQVNFCDATAKLCSDIHLLGTAQLTGAGTAEIKFVPGKGAHSYNAVFLETTGNAGSTSAASALTVSGKYATTTTLAEQGVPGNYTLTATVDGSVYEAGLAAPTGTVSFLDTSNANAVLATAPLGNGSSSLTWSSVQTSAPFYTPESTVVADFNGDGIPDIAAVNSGDPYVDGSVTILLGKGDGTFTAAASPATGREPWAIAAADFNGDGKVDLAVTNSQDATVTILMGNGDGTFTATPESPGTGSFPYSITVADFNGDGVPDLATSNYGDDNVTIFFGQGNGMFAPALVSPATGGEPFAIATGDFNGDGKADLAVANESSDTVTILLGHGDGTFVATAVSPSTGSGPCSVSVGDLNEDGKADLAVGNCQGTAVTILLGNGNGTFTAGSSAGIGNGSATSTIGDFNGDGKPDLLVRNQYNDTASILLGKGDGTFTAVAGPSTGGAVTAVGDFNGDGRSDMVAVTGNGNVGTATGFLTVLTNTATATVKGISPATSGAHKVEASYPGNSSYASSVSAPLVLFKQVPASTTTLKITSGSTPVTTVASGTVVTLTATVTDYGVAVTDGLVNFCNATAAHCTDIHILGTAQLTSAGTAVIKLVPGVGSHSYKAEFVGTTSDLGSSSSASALTVSGKIPTRTTLAASGAPGDYTLTATVNGSAGKSGTGSLTGSVSFIDTSNANRVLATASLVKGASGVGWFGLQTPVVPGNSPITIATGDFNRDGIPDLVVGGANWTTVSILLGNGDGTFTEAPNTVTEGNYSYSVAVGDLNGDGIPDLAVATSGNYSDLPGSVSIWLGNGDGTFTLKSSPATGIYPQSVAIGDFNGDGIPDLAVANYSDDTVTILLGNGDGTFTPAAVSPPTGSSPYFVGVGDFNGDGIQDLAVANSGESTLTILLGKGNGTFTAAVSPSTGNGPAAIAIADLNGDGKADLAVANYKAGTMTVLLGKGDGTFTTAPASSFTGSPTYIVAGDFNGDGIPDLALANINGDTVAILQGKGDGTFTAAATPPTGANPDALAVADFNGDGIADVATANFTGNSVTVLLADSLTATATATGVKPEGPAPHQIEASYPGNAGYDPSVSTAAGLFASTPTPIFSLAAGTYTTPQSVAISDSMAGATIYFTTDGTTPTSSSAVYSEPITVTFADTIQAIAIGVGYGSSAVATAKYTITPAAGSTNFEWSWMDGSDSVFTNCASNGGQLKCGQSGVYGAIGKAAAANIPGGRQYASKWTDSSGKFWLFGGLGYDVNGTFGLLNDLWVFDPSTSQWTWKGGSSSLGKNCPAITYVTECGQSGVYGTLHKAASGNIPGGRSDAASWIDAGGHFWLFGGIGFDSKGNWDFLNDLWEYDPSNSEWTWMGGSSVINTTGSQYGVYGTLGTPSAANIPGGRLDASYWVDHSGHLWLFGGNGFDSQGNDSFLNDLWEFDLATNEWTWMGGYSITCGSVGCDPPGNFGTLGVPAAGNIPPGLYSALTWTDSSGNTWLFGGFGLNGGYFLNDLWKFFPATNEWEWLGGVDNTQNMDYGVYGTLGTPAAANIPGGRDGAMGWLDKSGDLWMFAGLGNSSYQGGGYLNDLWQFNLANSEWGWMGGGTNNNGALGVYGTKGTPAPGNLPGSRLEGMSWTDSSGNFWLFGGYGYDAKGYLGYLNDLWKYHPGAGPLLPAATPTFSVAAGTYTADQAVSISDTTAGATIYYTTNGAVPTTSSAKYTGAIKVSETETIQAIAVASGHASSAVATATYTLQAAAPKYSPAAGTYNSIQSVAISDATAGATIYYTTNGTKPTASSTKYTAAIKVGAAVTLEAIAVAAGHLDSAVSSAKYTLVAATPKLSPAAGTYKSTQSVTISDATAGATIYYTTNDTTPTTASTKYTGAISVSKNKTLKAIAVATGFAKSAVADAAYFIQASAPVFTPASGAYASSQRVTITDATVGATIYYTTNGTTPTTTSTKYTAALTLSAAETLQAIAVATGYANSPVTSASYTVESQAAKPVFSPAAGTFADAQKVTIADATPDATIYYTTDGSSPTTSSSKYSGPISVATTETIKVIADAPGYSISPVHSATYTIQ